MSAQTLFLAWQDKRDENCKWFPVGMLDIEPSHHRFRYIHGAKRAEKEAGFIPVMGFSRWDKEYESPVLFPVFQNRVMAKSRKDRQEYLANLGLKENATPFEILSVSGGNRATDNYQVFPKIRKGVTGRFKGRFLLRGLRYINMDTRKRIGDLLMREDLYLALELNDPKGERGVQIQTTDRYIIGWAPRYLVDDLTAEGMERFGTYKARVVRINLPPAPTRHRVLVEITGRWEKHEPMSGADFEPLVKD